MVEALKRALKGAADLVDAGWCQGEFAMDVTGMGCKIGSKRAIRFCAIGAIHRACIEERLPPGTAARAKTAIQNATGVAVSRWNDDARTADEVSGMMRAIAAA